MKKTTLWMIGLVILVLAGLYGLSQYKSGSSTADEATLNKWSKGSSESAVTLIEYSDFQCPACAAYLPLVKRLAEDYKNQLKIVYRFFPLMQIHQNGLISSKAGEAAGRQNKFWEMHDLLFEKQQEWAEQSDPTDMFAGYARQLGLDEQKFRSDLKESDVENTVLTHARQGDRDGVNGTPTFFLNGEKLKSPQSYDEFKSLIEALLPGASSAAPAVSSSPAYSTKNANP